MNEEIFNECLERWSRKDNLPFWQELADKYGYTKRRIRYLFTQERKRRNITSYNSVHTENSPKIFIADIETSTFLARLFSRRINGYISHKNVVNDKDYFMISWAGYWFDSDIPEHDVVTPKEALKRDDERICLSLTDVINRADIIIGHNLDGFDVKSFNWRLFMNGLPLPYPYRTIDTLKASRKVFKSTSLALDYFARSMKLPKKLSTGFDLWIQCEEGNEDALRTMDEYCVHDTWIGREVYREIMPYMKGGVNWGLYTDLKESVCSKCGGKIVVLNGENGTERRVATTGANSYYIYECLKCGHSDRTKKSSLTLQQRKNLVT